MSGSGMFDNFERKLREEIRREFRNSETGRLLTEMEKAGQSARDARGNVIKYAKKPFMRGILEGLLAEFGPVGAVIKSLMRPKGKSMTSVDRELMTAKALIEAFGGTVNMSPDMPGGSPQASGGTLVEESLDDTERLREAARREREREIQSRIDRNLAESQAARSQQIPGQIEIHIAGRKRYYDQNDPIITGEMIEVRSSNVHSIGFQLNYEQPLKSTLLVRFLQKRQNRTTGPGPLYAYYDVHPDLFDAFQNAASKGRWVWDRLRIRGTVTGHQKRYQLIGVVNGYVPRQAVRFGGNQYFIQRQLKMQSQRTGRKAMLTSSLSDQRVGTYQPSRDNILNRGLPNRGEPNRGR